MHEFFPFLTYRTAADMVPRRDTPLVLSTDREHPCSSLMEYLFPFAFPTIVHVHHGRKSSRQISTLSLHPIVRSVLLWLGDGQADVPVSKHDVQAMVYLKLGIDVRNPFVKLQEEDGLNRQIWFAVRNQIKRYNSVRNWTGLEQGKWLITEEGVTVTEPFPMGPELFAPRIKVISAELGETATNEQIQDTVLASFGFDPTGLKAHELRRIIAQILTPIQSDTRPKQMEDGRFSPCITAEWLGQQPPKFHETLREALMFKMQKSVQVGSIDDHVQTAYTRWIQRDAFRIKIESGHPPTVKQCCNYLKNSAFTDIRTFGRDALGRHLGALTARTREKMEKIDAIPLTVHESPHLQKPDTRITIVEGDVEFVDQGSIGDPESLVQAREEVREMRKLIARKVRKRTEEHVKLFDMIFLEGTPIDQMVIILGVPREIVKSMLGRIRKILVTARART